MENFPNSMEIAESEKNGDYPPDFDTFLVDTVGEFGWYQKFLVGLLCLPTCFLSSFASFDLIFLGYAPAFNCTPPSPTLPSGDGWIQGKSADFNAQQKNSPTVNATTVVVSDDQCRYVVQHSGNVPTSNFTHRCTEWTFDQTYMAKTLVTRWNLVCDAELKARIVWSLMNLGSMAAVVYSYLQDRYGRKKTFLVNLTVFLIGSVGSVVFPRNIYEFGVMKFIGGISTMWEIGLCWSMEFIGASAKRSLVTTFMCVSYGFANMLLALVAWLCRDYVHVGLWTSLPFVWLFSFIWLVPESPRWLFSQNRIDEAFHIVRDMAARQKSKFDDASIKKMLHRLQENIIRRSGGTATFRRLTVLEFFKSKNLLAKNLVLTYFVIVANQLYSTIPYDSHNLHPNFFVAYLASTAVETPATLLNLLFVNKIGRIFPLCLFTFLSAFCCLITWPLESYGHMTTLLLATVSRFFICAALGLQEQVAEETFPTVGRGVGDCVSYIASALVAFSTQYIVYSANVLRVLPLVIIGSLTMVSSFTCLFLPETLHKPMPDTVKKAEENGSVGFTAFWNNVTFGSWKKEAKQPVIVHNVVKLENILKL